MAKADKNAARKNVSELTGVDFSTTGVKIVRLRRVKGSVAVVGADLLPSVPLGSEGEELLVPKALVSNYAALAYTGEAAVIRVIQMPCEPGAKPEDIEPALRQQLNVDDTHRTGCYVIQQSKGKQESTLLAVAIPKSDFSHILYQFETGAPAAYSLELSGLAAFSGFMEIHGAEHADEALCLIESGARVTTLVFAVRGQPVLAAKFALGAEVLNKRIEADLGVDGEMARTILAGGSVDISSSVEAVMTPFLRQLSVSRDFVERQSKLRVGHAFISGGPAKSAYWTAPISESLGLPCQAWDPLEGLNVVGGVWPEKLENQQHRFAAAIGAALGGLSEE